MKKRFNSRVSVIIPCYNNEAFVGDAIESALAQTYKNLEIVCINDGSTDNSSKVIKQYADKYKNILFLNEIKNRGVCTARNLAIKACSGEYILPLDADDKIEPEYIEKAVQVLEENKEIGIVYCKANFFGKENKEWELPDFEREKIVFGNMIFCTALFRKTDFEKVGGYKEYMNAGCEDWDLWLSFIENGLKVFRIDQTLFHYRQVEHETRTDKANKSKLIIYKNIFKNHIALYLDNDEFLKNVFEPTTKNPKEKKLKKYKKLFHIFLNITIFEFIIIILFLIKALNII